MSSRSPLGEDTPLPGVGQGRVVAGNHPQADQPGGWSDLDSHRISSVECCQGGTYRKNLHRLTLRLFV